MAYLIAALRPGSFADSLAMQPLANMDDLHWIVEELQQIYKNIIKGDGETEHLIPQDSGTCIMPKGSQGRHPSILAGPEF